MFCAKCGAQIEASANFCAQCGTPVTKAVATGAAQPAQRTSGMATASLVCGIAGFFFGPLLAILAIIFSIIAFPQFPKDPSLKGKGMAIAGLVLGIVGLIWSAFWIIWVPWVFFFI